MFEMESPRLKLQSIIASMLNNKGVVLMQQKKYAEAQISFSRALRACEQDNDSNLHAKSPTKDLQNESTYLVEINEKLNHLFPNVTTSGTKRSEKALKYRREYDEGMDHFNTPFRLKLSSSGLKGTIKFNLGRMAHSQGKFANALALYKGSFIDLMYSDSQEDSIVVAILFCTGQIQYIQNNPQDALTTFMMALNLSQSVFGCHSLAVASCLNSIGVLHYSCPNGDSNVALQYLLKSLRQRRRLQVGSWQIGTVWNNIGRVHFQHGNLDLAIEAYLEALKIRKHFRSDSLDCAATMFNIGQVYHHKGELTKALDFYKQFESLAKRHFGEYHRDICMVKTHIGQVHHERKDFEVALTTFESALRLGYEVLGYMHPDVAVTLNKMGNLYYELGDEYYEKALHVYHTGLKIELANASQEGGITNVSVTLTNIALIYTLTFQYDESLVFYKKLLDLQKESKCCSADIAKTYSYIGYTHHKKGDYEAAIETCQESLRLQRDALGDKHEDVATTLNRLGLAFIKLEKRYIALQVLGEAYKIRKEMLKPNLQELALTLYNIALIYHKEGDTKKSLAFYLETSYTERNLLGQGHQDLSITYFNIGQIYFQSGQLHDALTYFKACLKIERHYFGTNHLACARTLNEIGNVHLQLGDIRALTDYYSKALRIYQEAGDEDQQLVVVGLRLWRFELVQSKAAPMA